MVEISNHSGTFSGAKFNEKVDEFLGIQFAHAERFQAPIDIEKYYEKYEYNICIIKMFNALKNLKFDIIKSDNKEIEQKFIFRPWFDHKTKTLENWEW